MFHICDDAVYVTIYTDADDPSFRFKLSDVGHSQKWIDNISDQWLRAMKEREAELDRRKRLQKITSSLTSPE